MASPSTIAAVATGPAPGSVGILRVSGPEALQVARTVAPGVPVQPVARRAYFVKLEDGRGGLLDEGLALHFPAPHSYTGEDVVELHAHGSPRLLSLLLTALLSTGRARLAEPGEFTRRAFLNGRLDLQRAEGVADLVAAESEAAVRAAAAQVAGALSGRLSPCVEALRALHADLEAVLAFPDEAGGAEVGMAPRVGAVASQVEALAVEAARGRVVRRGARVVLVGPPNAGKSTLFNRLLGEERALVDDAPGTTRDALEARLELDGLAVTLVDTAGLREAPGRLEALGVARARRELASADLVLLLLPPGEDVTPWLGELPQGTPWLQLRGKSDVAAGALAEGGGVQGAVGTERSAAGHEAGVADEAAGLRRGGVSPGEDVALGGALVSEPRVEVVTGESRGPSESSVVSVPAGLGTDRGSFQENAARGESVASESLLVRAPGTAGERSGPSVLEPSIAGDSDKEVLSPGALRTGSARPGVQGVPVVRSVDGGADASAPDDGLRTADTGLGGDVLPVSGLTGEGVEALFHAVRARLLGEGTPGAVAFASERHAECLARAAAHLSHAALAAEVSTLEVVAGEVGLGLQALLAITGEDAGEALLDDIFRRFCIGK